jgi:hypothetical protein
MKGRRMKSPDGWEKEKATQKAQLTGRVRGIDKDDLVVVVGTILVDPVGVQDTEVTRAATDALLGDRPEVADGGDEDTLRGGLTVDDTLGNRPLAATTTDGNAVDDVALLGLVAETPGLVGASGVVDPADLGELPVLPSADAEEEAEHIALLLAPELLEVLVSAHFGFCKAIQGERGKAGFVLRASQANHETCVPDRTKPKSEAICIGTQVARLHKREVSVPRQSPLLTTVPSFTFYSSNHRTMSIKADRAGNGSYRSARSV